MFPIFLLPVTVYAAANCPNIHDATTCGATAGCYWNGTCGLCPANYFCTGWNNNLRSCEEATNDNFNLSFAGSTSVEDCYKTINCKWANDSDTECRHYQNGTYVCSGTNSNGIHIENGQCYIGHRDCSLFYTTGCSGTIYGDAQWNSGIWNVTLCECRQEEFDDTANFCHAKRNKKAYSTTVTSVNDTIIYTNGELKKRWCISCLDGYYIERNNILSADGSNNECIVGEESNGGQYAVCACTVAPQGTWISTCNVSYPILDPDSIQCSPTNCPAGKTTNSIGSTSINDCHYTNQTKFCDAKGCFNITDAANDGWDWN
ncbi:MAG: hypothetical protein II179_02900 [Alphaproteobacteria bacterium]|nr:hypothetical protein [Alphaproteobacteria bacterium]